MKTISHDTIKVKDPVTCVCAGCVHSGVQYDHGANWRSAENPCDVCFCSVGRTLIDSLMFPSFPEPWLVLKCSVPSPGGSHSLRERTLQHTVFKPGCFSTKQLLSSVSRWVWMHYKAACVQLQRRCSVWSHFPIFKSVLYQIEGVIYWLCVQIFWCSIFPSGTQLCSVSAQTFCLRSGMLWPAQIQDSTFPLRTRVAPVLLQKLIYLALGFFM